MPNTTRGRLLQIMDSILTQCRAIEEQYRHIIYVFQSGEEKYNTHYAENIVMAHEMMEAINKFQEACIQYRNKYM